MSDEKFDAWWAKEMYGYAPGWMCEETFNYQQDIIDGLEAENERLEKVYEAGAEQIKRVLAKKVAENQQYKTALEVISKMGATQWAASDVADEALKEKMVLLEEERKAIETFVGKLLQGHAELKERT